MPTGNLPAKAKKVFLSAEKSARKTCPKGDRFDECVARKGWAAVKKGWRKEGDKWVPKSTAEFSLYINKASYNKETREMHWYAVASDTDPDLYEDEMSLELYSDFTHRIETKELPPERHQSDYWSGGLPYMSVSHYLDLNGKGVPGPTDNVYVDGKCLKANGRFNNTVLGKACFDAICKDLYGQEEKSDNENKIRVSIAFIDWSHTHKSNGYEFERESLNEICPECLKELITGEGEGKIFQKGHLIHLALTRVPVNERTTMEVRSMTTQKEDAVSIIGEDVHDETFAEKEDDELKADLVIKSEQEEPIEEVKAKAKKEEKDEEEEEEKEDKKKKKEEKSVVVNNSIEEPVPHILASEVGTFLATYDMVAKSDLAYAEKLKSVQEAFEHFGEAVAASFAPTPKEKELSALEEIKAMLAQLLSRQDVTERDLAVLKQKGLSSNPQETRPEVVRRSLDLNSLPTLAPAQSETPGIRAIAERTVGFYN